MLRRYTQTMDMLSKELKNASLNSPAVTEAVEAVAQANRFGSSIEVCLLHHDGTTPRRWRTPLSGRKHQIDKRKALTRFQGLPSATQALFGWEPCEDLPADAPKMAAFDEEDGNRTPPCKMALRRTASNPDNMGHVPSAVSRRSSEPAVMRTQEHRQAVTRPEHNQAIMAASLPRAERRQHGPTAPSSRGQSGKMPLGVRNRAPGFHTPPPKSSFGSHRPSALSVMVCP
eukprot:m.59166 g.59166  ORF g.59166 m.59166 type:complete len:229 (+) comp13808_c0_seq1:419-1105(+)